MWNVYLVSYFLIMEFWKIFKYSVEIPNEILILQLFSSNVWLVFLFS
jgi:hypothetical protein